MVKYEMSDCYWGSWGKFINFSGLKARSFRPFKFNITFVRGSRKSKELSGIWNMLRIAPAGRLEV